MVWDDGEAKLGLLKSLMVGCDFNETGNFLAMSTPYSF